MLSMHSEVIHGVISIAVRGIAVDLCSTGSVCGTKLCNAHGLAQSSSAVDLVCLAGVRGKTGH